MYRKINLIATIMTEIDNFSVQWKISGNESKSSEGIKQTHGIKKRRFIDIHTDMKPSITYQEFLKVLKEQKDREDIKERRQKIFKKDVPQMKEKHSFNQLLRHDIYGYSKFIQNLIADIDHCKEQANVVLCFIKLRIQYSYFSANACHSLLNFQISIGTCFLIGYTVVFQKKIQAQHQHTIKNSQALLQYDKFGIQIFIIQLITWNYNHYLELETYAKDHDKQIVVEKDTVLRMQCTEKFEIAMKLQANRQDDDFDDNLQTKVHIEKMNNTCVTEENKENNIRSFKEFGDHQKKDMKIEIETTKRPRSGKEKIAVAGRFLRPKKSASEESLNRIRFMKFTPHMDDIEDDSNNKTIQKANKKKNISEKQFTKISSHTKPQYGAETSPIELSKFNRATKKQQAILLNTLFERQVKTCREAEIILRDLERLYQQESSLSGCFCGMFKRKSKVKKLLKQLIPVYREYVHTKLKIIPEDGQQPCCSFWEDIEWI